MPKEFLIESGESFTQPAGETDRGSPVYAAGQFNVAGQWNLEGKVRSVAAADLSVLSTSSATALVTAAVDGTLRTTGSSDARPLVTASAAADLRVTGDSTAFIIVPLWRTSESTVTFDVDEDYTLGGD